MMLLCAGCSQADHLVDNKVPGTVDGAENLTQAGLISLAVTAGGTTYSALIDHYAGTARIPNLKELETINGVNYRLADKATIYPEPSSFIGAWDAEQNVVVTLDGVEKVYKIVFAALFEPDPDDKPQIPGLWDYDYNPNALPKDNECAVYDEPYLQITRDMLRVGDPHPNSELAAQGWMLYTLNEFSNGREEQLDNGDGTVQTVIQPHGLYPFDTENANESAKVNNLACARVEDGRLIMEAHHLDEVIATGKPQQQYNPTGMVEYEHASFRSYPETNQTMGTWFTFRPYMRFEARFRRSDTVGFNNAIWFQGNITGVGWPSYGEIDLLENPKPSINQAAHSTIHCGAYSSNTGNAKTDSGVTLDDMKHWNIYWVELYPDKIVFGVNGRTKLTVTKGAADTDFAHWPWTQAEGFYMLLTTGMHDAKHSSRSGWQGNVRPVDFEDPDNLPSMEVDWIRVYVNEGFWDNGGKAASGIFY